MKLNPLNVLIGTVNNTTPQKPEKTNAEKPQAAQKTELYSSSDSIAIKNLYGASIITTKGKLQKEANDILQMCPQILQDAKRIQNECDELTKDDVRIQKYAKGMYINAKNLYGEAKIYEDDKREGYFKTSGRGGSTNLAYFEKGKLKKILINVKTKDDKMYTEHSFSYMNDNVLYQKDAITKDGATVSCNEEFFYIQGECQRYDKGITVDNENKSRATEETRLYKKDKVQYIAQNIQEKNFITHTDKIYYFDPDGFDAYVENQTDKATGQKKETIYDYTLGELTNYVKNDVWANCKNNNDLKINFRNEQPYEAFINSEMAMSSFMTADKQYIFEDFKPKKALVGYERTSYGTVSSKREVEL